MSCAWCHPGAVSGSHGMCDECRRRLFSETLPGGADYEAAKKIRASRQESATRGNTGKGDAGRIRGTDGGGRIASDASAGGIFADNEWVKRKKS